MLPRASRATRRPLPDSASGFTLIEVLITIAVLVILLAIAMPQLGRLIHDQRVKGASADLHASLVFARSEAIKRSKFVAVCAKNAASNDCQGSTNWSLGWLVFIDENGDGAVDNPATDILAKQDAIANVTFSGTDANVSYQRDGRMRASVAAFVVSSSVDSSIKARCLNLDLSGRPNIKLDSDSDATNGC